MIDLNKKQITIKSLKELDIKIESYFKKNNKLPLNILYKRKRKIDNLASPFSCFLYFMNKKWSNLWFKSRGF
jgi:predicted adenine nucleotide alpha hydrolase (AANH) superfamily ATPase